MVVQVRLPSPLRGLADGQTRVAAVGNSVGEVLNDLGRQYPGIEERLYDDEGSLRRYINIYLSR